MIQVIINWLKTLFGLDKPKDRELEWLEKKASEQKKKLEEIDNEDHSIDDIADYFNE